ncbi:hypothetical protein F4820DRAFT_468101 [Hypoxylon rubiginosum]|uniref:Uncharacterized protein n=1 Tax=Hypoxylon rubiginosum TaxID=110542 RepID=A0ACB9YIE2_9PEZI|nr:hypothetical protein F4820DRAFT_468101 [Hypoxylon rubiginosum]
MLVSSMLDVLPAPGNNPVKSFNDLVSIHITEKEIIANLSTLEEPEVELEVNCSKAQEIALRGQNLSRPSIIRLDLPPAVSKNPNKLIEAWNILCTRHYILRASIVKGGSGKDVRFQQEILKQPKYVSVSSLEDFELLRQDPEVACLVMYRPDEIPTAYLYLPYAIVDRTSLGYIWKDFLSHLAGGPLPPRLDFSEYCKRASKRRQEEAKNFWAESLGRTPALIVHSIPLERHQTKQTTELESSCAVSSLSIKRLSNALSVSTDALIYTAFGIMLDRHSQASNGATVFAVEGRDKTVEGHDTVLGFVDQEYPLKFQFDPRQPVAQAIRQMDHSNVQASSNTVVSYDELEHTYEAVTSDFKLTVCEDDTLVPADDQFSVSVTVKLGRSVAIAARHDTAIPAEKMKVLLNHFMTAIVSIVSNPMLAVDKINIIAPDEQSHILEMGKPASQPVHDNVHRLFERQVELTPDAPAVQFEEDAALSYDELNRLANRVARQLPVGRGSFVPVCLKRSINLIVSLVAILKTGAAYVTMDPDTPHERNRFIVDDVGAKFVVVDRSTAGSFQNELVIEDIIETSRLNEDVDMSLGCEPKDPVYVIYTSGSTGKPKGVLHASPTP